MKALVTGASGFLGREIVRQLDVEEVITLSRRNAQLEIDLGKGIPKLPFTDLIVHCAGKAHMVPRTDQEKQAFFDVNVTGTENLLTGLEQAGSLPKYFIFISSVSVYGLESGILINEDSPLLAKDPYGLSKIHAEKIVQEWCNLHNVTCTILRLPLLIGLHPVGNLQAMVNGIVKGYYFNIAGGKAKKSMVHVEDVAQIISKVAEIGGVYNLTDGHHPSFSELAKHIAVLMGKSKPYNIPLWLASALSKVGDIIGPKAPINSAKLKKMMSDLTFNDERAKTCLGWNPSHVLEKFNISPKPHS